MCGARAPLRDVEEKKGLELTTVSRAGTPSRRRRKKAGLLQPRGVTANSN